MCGVQVLHIATCLVQDCIHIQTSALHRFAAPTTRERWDSHAQQGSPILMYVSHIGCMIGFYLYSLYIRSLLFKCYSIQQCENIPCLFQIDEGFVNYLDCISKSFEAQNLLLTVFIRQTHGQTCCVGVCCSVFSLMGYVPDHLLPRFFLRLNMGGGHAPRAGYTLQIWTGARFGAPGLRPSAWTCVWPVGSGAHQTNLFDLLHHPETLLIYAVHASASSSADHDQRLSRSTGPVWIRSRDLIIRPRDLIVRSRDLIATTCPKYCVGFFSWSFWNNQDLTRPMTTASK